MSDVEEEEEKTRKMAQNPKTECEDDNRRNSEDKDENNGTVATSDNGNGYVEFTATDNNCFIDNASVDTASLDNNCFQDSMSVDNSSINVSMDLHDNSESTLDLQEITQSILDLEGTQTTPNTFHYCTSTEMQRLSHQIPSSPPPSYEHVLAETKLAQQSVLAAETNVEASSSVELPTKTKDAPSPTEPQKRIEIMHKTHKEFYRAVAKQWGITCKMSDHCRCLDCQSMYFECEYNQNEQTDGGLGAGTPMFISEVMHGSACTLL